MYFVKFKVRYESSRYGGGVVEKEPLTWWSSYFAPVVARQGKTAVAKNDMPLITKLWHKSQAPHRQGC